MAPRKFDRYMVAVGAGTHPKFARLTDGERCAHFLGVLAVAAMSPVRGRLLIGRLPAEPVDVARAAGVPERVAAAAMRKLEAVGVLCPDEEHRCLRVHDWDDINPPPKSDPSNAERQRQYRARNADRNSPRNGHVTASVTLPEVEVEVEVEGKAKENPVVAASPPPPKADPVEQAIDDLCHLMSHHVRVAHGIDPRSHEARVTKGWRAAGRGLLTLDTDSETGEPYTREQIAFAIEWVCRHHYWRNRIKSMTRLRSEMTQVAKDIRGQRGGQVVHLRERRESASDWLQDDFIDGEPIADATVINEEDRAS